MSILKVYTPHGRNLKLFDYSCKLTSCIYTRCDIRIVKLVSSQLSVNIHHISQLRYMTLVSILFPNWTVIILHLTTDNRRSPGHISFTKLPYLRRPLPSTLFVSFFHCFVLSINPFFPFPMASDPNGPLESRPFFPHPLPSILASILFQISLS